MGCVTLVKARWPSFEEVGVPKLSQGHELDEASPQKYAGAQSNEPNLHPRLSGSATHTL